MFTPSLLQTVTVGGLTTKRCTSIKMIPSISEALVHGYTITNRQAVTKEIDLKALIPLDMPSILCQELLHSLESVNMQKLVATVDNLSSILRDLGNQTVDLVFSKVLLINDISYLHTHCIIITYSTHVNHTISCAYR